MDQREFPQINMSGIKVAGVGGLGFVAAAVFSALYLPEGRAFTAIAAIGGVICGIALIIFRRARGPLNSKEDAPLGHLTNGKM